MRRYRLFDKESDSHPVMMVLSCIMDDSEDLTIGQDEKNARDLLKWLNERGSLYHIEVNRYDPEGRLDGAGFFYRDYYVPPRNHYDLLIYDDATATLMSMFFEGYEEIIPPEVLAAREAEAAAAEAREKEIAAQRAAEDAANAKKLASAKRASADRVSLASAFEPVAATKDDAAPPTRAWLMNVGEALHAAIFGAGYTKTQAQKRREKT